MLLQAVGAGQETRTHDSAPHKNVTLAATEEGAGQNLHCQALRSLLSSQVAGGSGRSCHTSLTVIGQALFQEPRLRSRNTQNGSLLIINKLN